jgi:hypothetical protein
MVTLPVPDVIGRGEYPARARILPRWTDGGNLRCGYGVDAERANARQVLSRALWGYPLLGTYLVASIGTEIVLAEQPGGGPGAAVELPLAPRQRRTSPL